MAMQSTNSSRLIDQEFGNCITPEDMILPIYNFYGHNYYRPWRWAMQSISKDFGSTLSNEKDKFQVTLDVQQFKPEEISVKVINNEIIIEAKHEERDDGHGFVSRQFLRRYTLPQECKSEDVTSTLSSDGILTITASKIAIEKMKTDERIVPIKFSASAVRSTKQNTQTLSSETQTCSTDTKSKSCDNAEKIKKDTQIMLREDHSRLLRPEYMKSPEAEKCSIDAKTKVAMDTKSKIDEIFAMSEKTNTSSGKAVETGTKMAEKKASAIEERISQEASATASSSEIIAEATSMSASASSKAYGESSMAALTEILTSSKSKTSEVVTSEETSFASSSMSSSLKMTSENLADIISAELKEAAENL